MSGVFSKDKANQLNSRNLKLIEEIAERTATIETKSQNFLYPNKTPNFHNYNLWKSSSTRMVSSSPVYSPTCTSTMTSGSLPSFCKR